MNCLFRITVAALVIGGTGCADRTPSSQAAERTLSESRAPEWTIAPEPQMQIGVAEGESAYQFHRVRGVARLSNGRIAVLDGGSSEVRLFGADGRFISKTGRQGSGPGEFRRPWALYTRSDTIVVIDPRENRLSLHGVDAQYLTSRPYDKSTDTGIAWLYDNSVIVGGAFGAIHDQLRQVIPRLPRPDSAVFFRELRVAGNEAIWMRRRVPNDTSSNKWMVFNFSGLPLGQVTVPSQFTIYDLSDQQLLGVWQDSLGLESVRTLGLVRSSEPVTSDEPPPSVGPRSTPSPTAHEKLRNVLQALALYQEHYYARPDQDYVYAHTLEELRSFEAPAEVKQTSLDIPPGVVVRIISGGRFGWFALAADTASGAVCGTGDGFVLPQTWSSHPLACF